MIQTPPGAQPGPPTLDPGPYKNVPVYNHKSAVVGLTATFLALSWIFSLLRLYVRFIVLRAPGWDDVFIILTMLTTTFGSVVFCIAPDFGLGSSIYQMTLPEVAELMRVLYIGSVPYPVTIATIKIALLFQYLRIFEDKSRHRLLCKVMIVIIAVWGTFFSLATWIPCYPVRAYWDFSIKDAKCWGFGARDLADFTRIFVSHSITNAIFDFVVFVIPAHLYFKPDTQKKTRISLIILFVLGLTVNLCSIWRLVYVIKLFTSNTGVFDPTWYSPTTIGLANLEVNLAAICAALPVFWPVLKTTWNRIFVTFEVSVTEEYGHFPTKTNDVELQSASSDRNLTLDPSTMPETWEPFVGDETTGLGENETIIESPAGGKRPKHSKVLEIFPIGKQL